MTREGCKIAKKILSGEEVTEEEKEALKPIVTEVIFELATEACEGVNGETTVTRRFFNMEDKEYGDKEEVPVPKQMLCQGQEIMDMNKRLKEVLG